MEPSKFLKKFIETASGALEADYDCKIVVLEWQSPKKARILMVDEDFDEDDIASQAEKAMTIELLEEKFQGSEMVKLGFVGDASPRFFNCVPHNLGSILYA